MSEGITWTQARVEVSRTITILFWLGYPIEQLAQIAGFVGMDVTFHEDTSPTFMIPKVEGEELPNCDTMQVYDIPTKLQ